MPSSKIGEYVMTPDKQARLVECHRIQSERAAATTAAIEAIRTKAAKQPAEAKADPEPLDLEEQPLEQTLELKEKPQEEPPLDQSPAPMPASAPIKIPRARKPRTPNKFGL